MEAANNQVQCGCGEGPKLIFACSGAADVGRIADLAARKLSADGAGKMFCLAGIGGRVGGIVETTRSAHKILVIDGCSLDCARKTLENADFSKFEYIRLSDLGMEKGKTAVADDAVDKVVDLGRIRLAN
jgi:uncharacterized metal-binding protein